MRLGRESRGAAALPSRAEASQTGVFLSMPASSQTFESPCRRSLVSTALIVAASAISLGAGVAVTAAARSEAAPAGAGAVAVESKLLERPGDRLVDSIEAHQEIERMRAAYEAVSADAVGVGIEVGSPPAGDVGADELAELTAALRDRTREAADATLVAGVSRTTLDAIASCESGGDPTAVSSDGSYRGKYQFDRGTWAAVGGSGDPAAAPEAEQDYRAALLYARSGSSPWPICG